MAAMHDIVPLLPCADGSSDRVPCHLSSVAGWTCSRPHGWTIASASFRISRESRTHASTLSLVWYGRRRQATLWSGECHILFGGALAPSRRYGICVMKAPMTFDQIESRMTERTRVTVPIVQSPPDRPLWWEQDHEGPRPTIESARRGACHPLTIGRALRRNVRRADCMQMPLNLQPWLPRLPRLRGRQEGFSRCSFWQIALSSLYSWW